MPDGEKASEDIFSMQSRPSPNISGYLQISRKEIRRLRRATSIGTEQRNIAFLHVRGGKFVRKAPQCSRVKEEAGVIEEVWHTYCAKSFFSHVSQMTAKHSGNLKVGSNFENRLSATTNSTGYNFMN
jgi:hypothetical protein